MSNDLPGFSECFKTTNVVSVNIRDFRKEDGQSVDSKRGPRLKRQHFHNSLRLTGLFSSYYIFGNNLKF